MILLRARTPVTYREIRDQFPGYQTVNIEAGLRAFERDKADLLDLGVPIRYVTPDEDDSLEDGGYVIDLKRFKMPERLEVVNDFPVSTFGKVSKKALGEMIAARLAAGG